MNEVLRPNEETRDRQRRAADPAASAWVSANAGSGKTTVLANRVIRLLLDGVEPSRILCITFTKAAAAHMSNKVFGVLSHWATAPDAALDRMLTELGAGSANAVLRGRARRLFARALDTPGGLKVLTIHAFCERLLHQFPFEAGVPAAFTVLDDRQRDELLAAARAEVLARAADGSDALSAALLKLVAETADATLQKALTELVFKGESLARLMRPDGANASARVQTRLQSAFGLGQGETSDAIDAQILDEAIEIARWPELSAWLRNGTTSDHRLADCLDAAHRAANRPDRLKAYTGLCLKKDGGFRALSTIVTKALRTSRPELAQEIHDEFERVKALLDRRKCAAAAERAYALLIVADAIWLRYAAEKARRGALDFADLIIAARSLIKNAGAAWVHFKLDQGLDHILVDEAQDTSPEQWDIVQGLTAEFTAGAGARPGLRTIFAVGDDKQSIFGFQGAAPEEFAHMRRWFARAHEAADLKFDDVQLTQSFRSAGHVLGAVDRVFAQDDARAGLSSDTAPPHHETARPDAPGRVEVWPLIEAQDLPESKPWDAPFDTVLQESPVVVLGKRIAKAVRGWTEGRDALGACTPVAPGEILVLVRSRGALFDSILRELKNCDLPVAGADRLELGTHIAALDLLALADALLLQDDDLALASVLKSPLFDLTDDDLLKIAPRRKGSLRASLRHEGYAEADARLSALAAKARRMRPFDFYADLLGAGGGRRAFRARLGHEVDDVLDEFLRLAMTYGETEPATLSGFTTWMRAASAEIKRDLDTGGTEIRVMTVHGAKGLEASLVVLADLGAERHASLAPAIYPVREAGAKEGEEKLLLWSPKKAEDPVVLQSARDAEQERERGEHRRLLYVAMTRAKDRLVIAGHKGLKTKVEGSWYGLVRSAFEEFADAHDVPELGGEVLVYRAEGEIAAPPPIETRPEPGYPDWLRARLAPERNAPEFLAPSRAAAHVFTPGNAPVAALPARERGNLLHRLLEELPNLAEADRPAAAERYLAQAASDWASEHADLIQEALALLADPALAPFVCGAGRAEVPIAGEIERTGREPIFIDGRIDRLIVDDSRILIIDFKSDRPMPARAPESYVTQLALYRALLARIFPGKQVECALLWTATRKLETVPGSRLDAALESVLGMAPIP